MILVLTYIAFLIAMASLGTIAWNLSQREREERLTEETLQTSQTLEESLAERLHEIEEYRHELAALLQELDLEQVREADERE